MAADNHAHYARIGFVVIIGVAAIAATLLYIGGFADRGQTFIAETYCDESVSGLSVGSAVSFRGVKVGEVRDITFVSALYDCGEVDDSKICIRMSLNRRLAHLDDNEEAKEVLDMMIRRGLHATVSCSGITGISRVELNFPRSEVVDKPISWHPDYICIPPAPSLMTSFSDAATRAMYRFSRMDFVGVWSNVARVAESAASISANLDQIVASERPAVSDILRDTGDAAASLKRLAEDLRANPSMILRENDPEPLPETVR